MRHLLATAFLAAMLTAGLPTWLSAQTAVPLPIAESNVIAAPRGERLLVLINLEPQRAALKGLSDAAIGETLARTGQAQAARLLGLPQYLGKFGSAEAIFAFVSSMDEYNRPNFGGMTRLGTATYKKVGETVELDKIDLNFQLFR